MSRFAYIRASSDTWTLKEYSSPPSFLLIHEPTGKSAFFQGDDADTWNVNILALDKIESANAWRAENTFQKAFDLICDSYRDVLTGGENF